MLRVLAGRKRERASMMRPASLALKASQDRVLEVFGGTVIIRGDPTGQLLDVAVIEEIVPAGVGAPMHRHTREDEISYVIEGTFRFWRGEEVLNLGPGGVALLPRDQAHTFRNVGVIPGRLLTVIAPAGFERFFDMIAQRGLGVDQPEELVAAAAEFGLQFLDPPLP